MQFNAKLGMLAAKQALGVSVDPAPAYKFFIYIELGGVIEAKFTSISGLSMSRNYSMHREGGNDEQQHQLVSEIKYGDVTLTRGVTFSTTLWDWFHNYELKNMSIILYSPYSMVPARWYDLLDAFPVELSGPELDTGKAEIAIETIKFTYKELKLNTALGSLGNF